MPESSSSPHLDWNAKLVRFFIHNTRLVWLLILALLIGGAFSLLSLRREGFPQISAKVVMVQTIYPGAAASEVESQVTKNIEDAVKDVKGLKDFSSTSQNSLSIVTVHLEESTNADQALQDVQTRVESTRASLPKDAEAPKVLTFNTGGPSFVYAVSDGGTIETSRITAQKVADALAEVKGIKSAKQLIDRKDRVNILFRGKDLETKGVNLSTLAQVIQATNINYPAGNLVIDGKEQAVVSVGGYSSLDDIRHLVVGINPLTKEPITLSDVADVTQGLDPAISIERVGFIKDGVLQMRPAALLSVELTNNVDIITTKRALESGLAKALSDGKVPKSADVVIVSDQGESTKQQVTEVVEGAFGAKRNLYVLGGIQLLFLAMLLFVNWRAALVAALSVPFSLGFTFIALKLMHIQLNTIVLFSLILVLGLIVDPAVVIVESIQRYRDQGKSGYDAVMQTGKRLGAAVFMAVLTSLIVFFPFGVVSGIFGQIIKYIPLTVVPALLASYFVPMAILPLLAERLLPAEKNTGKTKEEKAEGLSRFAHIAMNINRWVLDKVWRQVVVFVVSFVLVGLAVSLVAMGKVQIVQFSTPEDNLQLTISATFAKGLPLADRDKISQTLEKAVVTESAVKNLFYFDQSANAETLFIDLKDKSERTNADQKSKAVLHRLQDELKNIDGLTDIVVAESAVGPPESQFQIQTQLYANDLGVLESAAKNVGQYIAGLDHVTKIDDGFTGKAVPELQVEIDRTKAAQLGLTSVDVGQQLKAVLDQAKVTRYENTTTGRTDDVYLVNANKPTTAEQVQSLSVISRTGSKVKVDAFAKVTQSSTRDTIQRFNSSRFVNVKARVDDQKNVLSVQQKLDQYLSADTLKELGLSSRDNKGEFDDIAKSFSELGLALVIAILLTYLVLVLQFKSFTQPAIMVFTVPLSFIGVFPALVLTKSNLGFLELLGVTILVGIVENVGIFLIDYANQLVRDTGVSAKEAIIKASGVRLRPILLTKLVALGGLLPLAIESDFWRGLSVVIIAGIGVSGFLSLVIIPILYVWISGLRGRVHRKNKAFAV